MPHVTKNTGQTNILQVMNQALTEIVTCLIKQYEPQQIILYGSLAYGSPHRDSDIDLLIIKETDKKPMDRRIEVRRLVQELHHRIPFSPLVLTPNELNRRLAMGDPFYQEIIQQGQLLYAHD